VKVTADPRNPATSTRFKVDAIDVPSDSDHKWVVAAATGDGSVSVIGPFDNKREATDFACKFDPDDSDWTLHITLMSSAAAFMG
jgi:hypothetical protein